TGEREPVYFCKAHYSSGNCPAPAAVRAERADACVRFALTDAILDGTLSSTMDAVSRYHQAQGAVEKAEGDLDSMADPGLLASLGIERYAAMAAQQREILREAQRALRETPAPGEAIVATIDLWGDDWPI